MIKENFLTVTAYNVGTEKREELKVNFDLIGAIHGNNVLLKDSQTELFVGTERFSDFELPERHVTIM